MIEGLSIVEKLLLEKELKESQDRKAAIEADPAAYAQEKVAAIQASLDGGKSGPGPIKPRKAILPGHISMYDHLQSLKSDYDSCAKSGRIEGCVAHDVARINAQISAIEASLKGVSR